MSDLQRYLDDNQERFREELFEYLRIPSVSSLSEHAGDVHRAGEWVARRFEAAGLENVELMPTEGHPLVYGDWLHAPGQPTVMIYGHFDVQPADPLELWSSAPFEPEIRDGRIYARGASDDKGNSLIPILAVEALLKTRAELPVNLKFLFEGQEEIGSPQVPSFLKAHREMLACDLVISADGGQYSEDQPGLCIGFKGMCAFELKVTGPDRDLHSGIYGGAVSNPIHALASIIDSLRDVDGRIAVEGFYDSVVEVTAEDRLTMAAVPHDDEVYKADLGLDELFGEAGYSTIERTWVRPTLELNGIWGGFQGEGIKTVIPSVAHAKITCRLVPDQDPERILEVIARHLHAHTPAGVTIEISPLEGSSPPYLMAADHPANLIAAAVLTELYGKAPLHLRSGGTLPICSHLQDILGVDTLMFAFALEDENFHSPDEFFRLTSFELGQRAYVKLLEGL